MWEMLAFQAEISYNIYVKSVLAHLVSIVSFRSLVGVLYLNLKVQDSYQFKTLIRCILIRVFLYIDLPI